ncbi:protein JASON-like isoform X1 [Raphanus sativus]|uniref:Protein JASON-like isoform X1 n=1 Tax=Raphanus sativus TaxID=3726 RepID=A0A9W3DB19_RAPSA|nr:protein JASON-like isoform X1 [Raphanus sativus]
MGCPFPCFRARAAQSTNSRGGDSVSQRGHDSKKNRLSDLFLSEEKSAPSPCIHMDQDLNDEAQFLKACGTTPATLVEIRKASENLETPQRGKQFTSSQFDSWISSNSDAVFHLYEKTPEPCGEEVSEKTPSSCITDSQNSAKISTGNSGAGEESQGSIGTAFKDGVDRTSKVPLTAGNNMGKIKSVRFECDFDQSYTFSSSKNTTSLKLSDEVQTHGTIFPENTESTIKGGSRVQACKGKTETESPLSAVHCVGKLEDSSASVSPGVKQSEEKSNNNMAASSTITYRDRPIIGMVAAHWNEKEQSQISPKWWDGNGIPNSTNKYKEDQKVSWHATPFEERLEKALSEEGGQGFIPPRKLEVMEEAERDTAMSQLHHSAQSTSIVSF